MMPGYRDIDVLDSSKKHNLLNQPQNWALVVDVVFVTESFHKILTFLENKSVTF